MINRFISAFWILLIASSCSRALYNPDRPVATFGTGSFVDAAWSPDGETLALASTRGVWLYPASDLSENGELLPIDGGAVSVQYSPSGDYLTAIGVVDYYSDGDERGYVWDAQTGRRLITIKGRYVENMSFSPYERYIVVAKDSAVSLWDLSSGQMIFEREGSNPIFAPDGEALLFNDRSGLHKWNIELDQEMPTKRNEFRFARAFRISPDGQTFATRFEDSDSGQMGLQIKSSETGENISTIYDYDLGGRYAQLEFSPSNPNLIAFVNYDSVSFPGFSAYIVLWDIQANSIIHRLSGYDSPLTSLNFSDDGRFLVTSEDSDHATYESYVRLWNVEDGSQIAVSPTFVDDDIYEARFSPDGTKVVSVHSDGVARIWRASDLELIQEIGQGNVDAQFSADGALIVTGNNRGRLSLWSIDTERRGTSEIASVQTDTLPLIQVAGDSTLSVIGFATGYYYDSEEDGYMHTIQIWNRLTGEVTVLYEDETNRVEEIAINPQGTILAAVMEDRENVHLWNVETGEPLSQILTGATDYIRTLQFSPDDQLLASGGCGRRDVEGQCDLGEINVWNVDAGERVLGPIHGHTSAVTALQFSPDGAKLISGSGGAIFYGSLNDYSIARWDMKTGTTLRAPATGHRGGITVLLYDNEGEFIFSGSGDPVYGYDSSIRAWNASLRRTLAIFEDNASPVEDLALVDVDDGFMLVSIHTDGTLRFWDIPFQD